MNVVCPQRLFFIPNASEVWPMDLPATEEVLECHVDRQILKPEA